MTKTGNRKKDSCFGAVFVDDEKLGRGDRSPEKARPLSDDWCRRNAEARQQ
jgi:hypothetical protein